MFKLFLVAAIMLLTTNTTQAQTHVAMGPVSPVNPGVFGANNMQAHGGNIIADPAYKALIRSLGIRHMRYLSGSPTSFWDWKRGEMVPQEELFAHLSHLASQYDTMVPLIFKDGALLDISINDHNQIAALQGHGLCVGQRQGGGADQSQSAAAFH